MLVTTLKISGYRGLQKYYSTFNTDTPEAINRSSYYFKKFCDSFGIDPDIANNDNFDLNSLIGLEGGVIVDYSDQSTPENPRTHIAGVLPPSQVRFLPPFVDAYTDRQRTISQRRTQRQTQQPQPQAQAQPQSQQQDNAIWAQPFSQNSQTQNFSSVEFN